MWNLVAAVFGTIAGILGLVVAVLLYQADPSLIDALLVAGGLFSTLCGITWIIAAVRD
jgi:hypothetical protein